MSLFLNVITNSLNDRGEMKLEIDKNRKHLNIRYVEKETIPEGYIVKI